MAFSLELNDACDALGLPTEPVGVFSSGRVGVIDGFRVEVWSGKTRDNDFDLAVLVRLPTGLDLHLQVLEGGLIPFRGAGIATGDGSFDGIFAATAAAGADDDVRALLGADVRALLRGLTNAGRPSINDEAVSFLGSALQVSVDELVARVRQCVALARAVETHAAALPAPRGVSGAVAAGFVDAARGLGLATRLNPLSAEGETGATALRVRWKTLPTASLGMGVQGDRRPLGYTVTARFHEPLGVGLSLRPAGVGDRLKALVGVHDLQLADAPFDRQWTIAATDATTARLQLGTEARAQLQRLAALGLHLTLDDAGLDGHGPLPTSPELVPEVLRRVAALRDALRPDGAVGPYR